MPKVENRTVATVPWRRTPHRFPPRLAAAPAEGAFRPRPPRRRDARHRQPDGRCPRHPSRLPHGRPRPTCRQVPRPAPQPSMLIQTDLPWPRRQERRKHGGEATARINRANQSRPKPVCSNTIQRMPSEETSAAGYRSSTARRTTSHAAPETTATAKADPGDPCELAPNNDGQARAVRRQSEMPARRRRAIKKATPATVSVAAK